jgi:hypothetical protein
VPQGSTERVLFVCKWAESLALSKYKEFEAAKFQTSPRIDSLGAGCLPAMRTHPIPALNPVISPASTAALNASRASLANALLLDLLARGMLKNKVMPKENFLLADAFQACDLLRAQGRTDEAKSWTDRIAKEPITDKLLRELKSSACELH